MVVPLKNELHNYSFSINRLRNDLYRVNRSIYPEIWKRELSSPHFHDFPQIWYCMKGKFALVFEETTCEIREGQLFVVPIGFPHRFMIKKETEAEIFSADLRYNLFANTDPGKYLNAKRILFTVSLAKDFDLSSHAIVTLCEESKKIIHEKLSRLSLNYLSAVSVDKTCELLEDIFSLPEFGVSKKAEERAERLWQEKILPILRAMEYINENYSEKILAEDMFRISTMGHTVFFTSFKKIMGESFLSYLQQVRLLHCHAFFGSDTYSMAYIATICGFSNQSHMERAYKKYSGVLPKRARQHSHEWRKACLEKSKTDNKA